MVEKGMGGELAGDAFWPKTRVLLPGRGYTAELKERCDPLFHRKAELGEAQTTTRNPFC